MKKLFVYTILIALITSGCFSNSNILTLKGDIANNIIQAVSTVPGRIIQMDKKQGEFVKKGEIIAVIDNVNQKYIVDQMQAVVNMKRAKLDELKAGNRTQQIDQAKAQVNAAKAQFDLLTSGNRIEQIEQAKSGVSIAKEALNSANITYDHLNTAYKDAVQQYQDLKLTKTELDDAKYKLDIAAKQISSAEYSVESSKQQLELLQNGATVQSINAARANYDAANAQLNLLQSGATKQSIDASTADLEQSIAQLNQAQNTLNNCNIIALNDGIIISKNFDLGDVVNVGSDIADVAISNDVYVVSYIPNEYLDKIYYNEPIKVITSIGTQTGKICYIDLKSEYTPKDKKSTSDNKKIATKIKVAIDDKKGLLKSGLTASIEIPIVNNR